MQVGDRREGPVEPAQAAGRERDESQPAGQTQSEPGSHDDKVRGPASPPAGVVGSQPAWMGAAAKQDGVGASQPQGRAENPVARTQVDAVASCSEAPAEGAGRRLFRKDPAADQPSTRSRRRSLGRRTPTVRLGPSQRAWVEPRSTMTCLAPHTLCANGRSCSENRHQTRRTRIRTTDRSHTTLCRFAASGAAHTGSGTHRPDIGRSSSNFRASRATRLAVSPSQIG